MIDGLQPYAAMRDSGVPWLGRIPDHWKTVTLKRQARFIGGGTPSKANLDYWVGNIPWVSPKDMKTPLINDTQDHISSEAVAASATQLIEPGAVLIVVRSGILQHSIPTAINSVVVAINQDLCAIVTGPALLPAFLRALIDGNQASLRMDWTKQGATVESIEHNLLANTVVPMPTESEQSLIVQFLDHVALKIQRYIRAKRKLIALLNELKQGIIDHAVTRGLDPNVRLKPSGIEWLGDVPEHWQVKKLRLLFRYAKGRRAAELSNEYIGKHPGPFPVYSGQTEKGGIMGTIDWHEFDFSSPAIFVSTVGARAMSTRLIRGKCSLSQNCAVIVPRSSDADPIFYENVFQRLFAYERASISLIMQPSLRFTDLNRFFVPQPPPAEQAAIARHLSYLGSRIDRVITNVARGIDLLREFHSRLSSDVVTGKLDVRQAVKNLPEYSQEARPGADSDGPIEDDDEMLVAEEETATEESVA